VLKIKIKLYLHCWNLGHHQAMPQALGVVMTNV
jgi:hypothetical protein